MKVQKKIKEMTETDKAYLAGFIDGEGCITISKKTCKDGTLGGYQFRLTVLISNTDKDIIDWVQDVTGLGGVYHYSKPKNPKSKQAWKITFWSNQAAQILETILPYLRIKKARAELAITFQRSLKATPFLTTEERENQIQSYMSFRILNKRGNDLCQMILTPTQK